MKKLPIISMLMFCLLLTSVLAFKMPYPVVGDVIIDNVARAGIEVTLVNLATGDTVQMETSINGEYMFELANLPNKYEQGQEILIKACTGRLECEQRFKVEGPLKKLNFHIAPTAMVLFKGLSIKAGSLIVAGGFWWFLPFLALVAYWYKKDPIRGKKMLTTFFKKVDEGKYNKKK